MINYAVVSDGLSAFGVEISGPARFRSVRGFLSEAEALAWIVEQDKAEARRLAVSAAKVRPASELIFRNRELLHQGERAQHRYRQLCTPSLLCEFPFHMERL
jgi:hypothetical protein